MGKYSGKPTPAEFVAGWLRSRGVHVDPDRLVDRVAAERERAKYDEKILLESVRAAAATLKRATRATEVAEMMWRQQPTRANLDEAMAAQRSRNEAKQLLLDRCDGDYGLMHAVLKQV